MASLSFTETALASGKTVYVAEISDKKGTINVDLEREVPGLITVYHRAHGATTYKGGMALQESLSVGGVNFNIVSEAPNASMDYKIVSDVSATGSYA
jgi:hypothetical protein